MQFEKTYTHKFFKDFKIHSSFGLVQFRSSLKNSLVHVFFQIALETILLPIQMNINQSFNSEESEKCGIRGPLFVVLSRTDAQNGLDFHFKYYVKLRVNDVRNLLVKLHKLEIKAKTKQILRGSQKDFGF